MTAIPTGKIVSPVLERRFLTTDLQRGPKVVTILLTIVPLCILYPCDLLFYSWVFEPLNPFPLWGIYFKNEKIQVQKDMYPYIHYSSIYKR